MDSPHSPNSNDSFFADEAEKVVHIIPLADLLRDIAPDERGNHRLISSSLLAPERRKQFVGFVATCAVAIFFFWCMFYDPFSLHSPTHKALHSDTATPKTHKPLSTNIIDERNNSTAVRTVLSSGRWTVGKDLPEGRYTITTKHGTGNIQSIEKDGTRGINEILSAHPNTTTRVNSVTTDLHEGEIITITELQKVIFTPASQRLSTTLSAGTWTVGRDVPAGEYTATSRVLGKQGTVAVLVGDSLISNETLGYGSALGAAQLNLHLVEGQTVSIHGLDVVELHKK